MRGILGITDDWMCTRYDAVRYARRGKYIAVTAEEREDMHTDAQKRESEETT